MSACLVCGDPATSGLNLDAKCLDLLAQDIATCARLHGELEAVLVRPTRPDEVRQAVHVRRHRTGRRRRDGP